MLSESAIAEIERLKGTYPTSRSALLPALHIAQREVGWLHPDAIADVARLIDLTAADVQAVASFYSMYYKEPVGRYVIDVCHNISCALLGGRSLLRHVCERLGVAEGEVTADGLFTVRPVECLAACDRAPCVQVNGMLHGPLTPDAADALLERLRTEARLREPQGVA
jgi:NADH-quinone oxidoreductase subunit E